MIKKAAEKLAAFYLMTNKCFAHDMYTKKGLEVFNSFQALYFVVRLAGIEPAAPGLGSN